MALDLLRERGTPLDRQKFTWRDLVRIPISKLDCDAFTRVRIIQMSGIERDALRLGHSIARFSGELRPALAAVRAAEQHQATLVSWLLPADQSTLETTLAYEQVAIEVTAWIAQHEPDPYVAQVFRFGLLEDLDHLYRFASLLDRLEGRDANNILQSYTDVLPGRPTRLEHRAPPDRLRISSDRRTAAPQSRLNQLTLVAGELQAHGYYMNVGNTYPDPVARQLYAEIAAVEEQHVTQYESLGDPATSMLEQWLLHEACEVWNYWACVRTETDARVKAVWERFLDYELGHLAVARELFEQHEKRDAAEVLPALLPDPISYESQRPFVRRVLEQEVNLQASGTQLVPAAQIPPGSPSQAYREALNADGSPSDAVAAGWRWQPGGELFTPPAVVHH